VFLTFLTQHKISNINTGVEHQKFLENVIKFYKIKKIGIRPIFEGLEGMIIYQLSGIGHNTDFMIDYVLAL
jgi:hypothetical protein